MTLRQLEAAIKKAKKAGVKLTSQVVICIQAPNDFFGDGRTVTAEVAGNQLFISGTVDEPEETEEEDDDE